MNHHTFSYRQAATSIIAAMVALAASIAHADDCVIVSTRGDNHIVILSGDPVRESARFDAGLGAHEIAISPDGSLAVGSAYGSGPKHQTPDQRLFVIDLAGKKIAREIDLGEDHKRPNDLVFLPDNRHMLATSEMNRSVIKVDCQEGRIVQVIRHDEPGGHMMAVSNDFSRCYVPCVPTGHVAVIDLATGELKKKITTAVGAEGIAVSPNGRRVWVACNRSSSIAVIDADTLEVIETIKADGFPFRVRFTVDGSKVVVSHPAAHEVRVYDASRHSLLGAISLGDEGNPAVPTSIALGDASSGWAVCAARGSVARLDVNELKLISEHAVGPEPDGLAWTVRCPG